MLLANWTRDAKDIRVKCRVIAVSLTFNNVIILTIS